MITKEKFDSLPEEQKPYYIYKTGKEAISIRFEPGYIINLFDFSDYYVELYYSYTGNKENKIISCNENVLDLYLNEELYHFLDNCWSEF